MKVLHIAFATALLGIAGSAAAMDITVTRLDDPAPVACTPTDCSLREAVLLANASVGADTIHLGAGAYQLTIAGAGEDLSASGDLDVRDDLTIVGAGQSQTSIVMTGQLDRVIQLYYDQNTGVAHTLNLQDLSVSGGYAHSSDPLDSDNLGRGGCIFAVGEMNLTNVTIGNCQADDAGGLHLGFGNASSLQNVIITGNSALHGAGGAEILSYSAPARISHLTVSNNIVSGYDSTNPRFAGGLYVYMSGAGANLDHVSLINNSAQKCGGGEIAVDGQAQLSDFTVTGNTAYGAGGGLCLAQTIHDVSADMYRFSVTGNSATGDGGGILVLLDANYPVNTSLRLHNANIADNTAQQGRGGGVSFPYCFGCAFSAPVSRSLTLLDSTLSNNSATAMSINDGEGFGGGIFSQFSIKALRSTFAGNQAAFFGGGICVEAFSNNGLPTGTNSIQSSTFNSNTTAQTSPLAGGGAIYVQSTGLTIDSSTFDNNAGPNGGVLFNYAAYVYLYRSTLAAGSNTPPGAVGTLVEAQGDGTTTPATNILNSVLNGNCHGVMPNGSTPGNLAVGSNSCGSSYVLNESSLHLGALADNGGPTQTRLPGAGSTLIGFANATYCATFDQRGYVRPNSATCDTGAVQTTAIDDVIFRNGLEIN